jgi:hypothetical protein
MANEPHRAAKHSRVTAELPPSRASPRGADSSEARRPRVRTVEHRLHRAASGWTLTHSVNRS